MFFESFLGCNTIIDALWNSVASRIRIIVTTPLADILIYRNLTRLAASFTIDACQNPLNGKKYGHSAEKLFQHFTTSVVIRDVRYK